MSTIALSLQTMIADAAAPATTGPTAAPQNPMGSLFFPLIIGLLIFMFFSFNSKRKQDKQRQSLLGAMKRGDRVQTIGGILGTIVETRENDVVVKVDESNNTKIKFSRSAIAKVMTEEEKGELAK